jgi:small ligand-binding sensory domain FIST
MNSITTLPTNLTNIQFNIILIYNQVFVVPWLRQLVAGLSPRRTSFAPRSVSVELVVDEVALGQVSVRVLRSVLFSIIPQ